MDQFLPDNEILKKWLEANGPAPKELDAELIRAVEEAGTLKTPKEGLGLEDAWNTFADAQGLHETIVKKPSWRKYVAIAATVIIILTGGWMMMRPQAKSLTHFHTPLAEHVTTKLPDGSTVIINAASSLDFDAQNWDEDRSVTLKGEAFFEVAKGETFTVHTSLGQVEVLGTSFNVYAREKTFKVACITGKVKVISDKNSDLAVEDILTPGHIFTQKNDSVGTVNQISFEAPDSWRKGAFNFENEPLNEVIAVMERQFGIQIDLDIESGRMYTGNFTIDDLEEAFVSVAKPMGLFVHTVGPKHYRLSGTANN